MCACCTLEGFLEVVDKVVGLVEGDDVRPVNEVYIRRHRRLVKQRKGGPGQRSVSDHLILIELNVGQ